MTVPDAKQTRMFAEAAETPDVVARQLCDNRPIVATLAEQLRADPPRGVVTCARGSSDHAATFAKYLIETRIGCVTASAAPSIASVYGSRPVMADMLAIGISQSGASPDILSLLDTARQSGSASLAMINVEDSPMARLADTLLPLRAGPEKSVAATKSYVAALSALVQLVAAWAADDELADALDAAPDLLRRAWDADWSALDMLADARGLYVIGRGIGFGVAQEAALKFKETCGLHAEAFSAAEVRHGPMALIGPEFPLLVFRQSDATGDGIDALVEDARARGAPVLVAGDSPDGAIALPVPSAHPVIEPMLQILAFYRAVNALAIHRGYDPDRPPHLAKVTETI